MTLLRFLPPRFFVPRTVFASMLTIVLTLPWAGTARALERDVPLSQLDVRRWSMADGAPASAWAIAQTDDGWLWFGSPYGLHRFDGLRFDPVDLKLPPLQSEGVSALYATRDGKLLIGYLDGGVSVMAGGRMTHYRADKGPGVDTVYSLTQDSEGVIWAATRGHLWRFDGERWATVGADWNFPDGFCTSVVVDRSGQLWVSTRDAALSLARGARSFRKRLALPGVSEFIESADGRLWSSSDGLLTVLPDQVASAPEPGRSNNSRSSFASLFDRDGAFWIVSATALSRIAYPERLADPNRLASPAAVADASESLRPQPKTILEDREGNLWGTLEAGGVLRVRRANVTRLDNGGASSGPHLAAFAAARDGSLWLAAKSSVFGLAPDDGLWRRTERGVERVQAADLPSAYTLVAGADGLLWVSGEDALWHQRADGRFERDLAFPAEWRTRGVPTMAVDGAQRVWVSVLGQGVFQRTASGTWLRNGGVEGLPAEPATVMTADAQGRLWLGYADGSLRTVQGGVPGARTVDARALGVGAIKAITTHRTVLIGGEHGLSALVHGQSPLRLQTAAGLRNVTGIVELDNGDVWLNARDGALRIAQASIQDALRRRSGQVLAETFDNADGYPGSSASGYPLAVNSMVRTVDGRIWLNGNDGIGWIDPDRVRRNATAPSVVLRELRSAGARFAPEAIPRLAPDTRQVQIAYTSLSYSQSERQTFKYRLSGVDRDWMDAGTRREAFYTNLGPGHYRFEALAANENGVWSVEPAAVEFDIAPTFMQTVVFRVACVIAALAAVMLLVRWRVRQLTERERLRFVDRMHERERIARELHDTLLQGTQGLVLTVQAAVTRMPADAPSRQMLEQALTTADRVMIEGRDRTQDLRASGNAAQDLPSLLARVAKGLSTDREVRIEVSADGPMRPLTARVADEAHQIGREAMINACRHAAAKSIDVRVTYDDDAFRLRVQDNGRGFEIPSIVPEASTESGRHWGLAGMRERSATIGGQLDIWTRSGAGTTVELRVPATVAYADGSAPRWWYMLRRT